MERKREGETNRERCRQQNLLLLLVAAKGAVKITATTPIEIFMNMLLPEMKNFEESKMEQIIFHLKEVHSRKQRFTDVASPHFHSLLF